MKKIQEMFDKEHEWVIGKMQSHLKQGNDMFFEEHRKATQRYKEYEGCYLGPRLQWFVWSFFTIGIILTALVAILTYMKYFG